MTGREAYELLSDASDWLAKKGPSQYIGLDGHLSIRDGGTRVMANSTYAYIGTAEFEHDPACEFRDGEALVPFVGLFHEVAGHGMQLTYEFNKKSILSKVLFLSHCACEGSAQYYGIDDNGMPHEMYFSHPHEIAAQYMGIKCGYVYLSGKYPDDAERMMLDYIAYRRELGCEFLPEDAKFDTVAGALKAMNKEFQRRVTQHRNFEPVFDKYDALGMFHLRRREFDALGSVRKCKNGLRQDHMMAAAFFENMAEFDSDNFNFLINVKVCEAISMDPNHVFLGSYTSIWPPPIKPLTNLERLRAITDQSDRDEAERMRAHGMELE